MPETDANQPAQPKDPKDQLARLQAELDAVFASEIPVLEESVDEINIFSGQVELTTMPSKDKYDNTKPLQS